MHTNIDRLKGLIKEHNKTYEQVAECIGVNRDTFTRRIASNGCEFKISELHKMMVFIPLTLVETIEVFFAKENR